MVGIMNRFLDGAVIFTWVAFLIASVASTFWVLCSGNWNIVGVPVMSWLITIGYTHLLRIGALSFDDDDDEDG